MGKSVKKDSHAELESFVQSINLAKAMNESLWVGDKYDKTLYVNPVFEKLSGYSLAECAGKSFGSFFNEESKRTIEAHYRLRAKGLSSQYEATMISKSAMRIPLLVSGAPIKNGGTMSIFTNLTQIRQLSQQEKLLSQVVKNSAEAIVVLDENRKIEIWNAGAEKLFGYNEGEIMGRSIDIIVPKEGVEFSKRLIEEVNERTFVRGIEVKRLTKDGEKIDVAISVTKVMDENAELIGYLVFYYDIASQKKTNFELQKRLEAIQDAYKELGLQKRQIDYMHEISESAVSGKSISILENLIVSAITLLTKSDAAVLRLYEPKLDALRLSACIGVSPKWWSKNKIPFKNSIVEDAFKKKRPIIYENVLSSPKYQGVKLLKAHKFISLIAIPLFVANQVVGSLSLYSKDPARFRLIETDFLENFGAQCSIALCVKLFQKSKNEKK